MERIGLIVDIVRSRELADRPAAQAAILDVFARAHAERPFREPLRATLADEFQAVFDDLRTAVWASAIARLLLPEGVDCRFGLGRGEIREIGTGTAGAIQDGPGWWRARAAIDEAHDRQDRRNPYLRTWFVGESEEDGTVNAMLLLRDQTISSMKPRERRIAGAALLGQPQVDIAAEEDVTQSAVSQSLRKSGGAALVAADLAMAGGA